MPLIEDDFDDINSFLDVAVRESDGNIRSHLSGSAPARKRSDNSTGRLFSVSGPTHDDGSELEERSLKSSHSSSATPTPKRTTTETTSHTTDTLVSESATVQSDKDATNDPQSTSDRVVELENELARLRFEAADYRSQADWFKLQCRQLRVEHEDLQAFCQSLQDENEELLNSRGNALVKRGWFKQSVKPKQRNYYPQATLSSDPQRTIEEPIHELDISNSSTLKSVDTTFLNFGMDPKSKLNNSEEGKQERSPSIGSTSTTSETQTTMTDFQKGGVYTDLSLDDNMPEERNTEVSIDSSNRTKVNGLNPRNWWSIMGTAQETEDSRGRRTELDDFELKDFRSPNTSTADSHLEALRKQSALHSSVRALGSEGHLFGMHMT